MRKIIAIYSLLFIFSIDIFCQKLLTVSYNEEDGLPSSSVYSVIQDSQGYIYFTTRNGLARYSGKDWKNEWNTFQASYADKAYFYKDENQDIWILSNLISKLLYKKEGNDWFIKAAIPKEFLSSIDRNYTPFAVSSSKNSFRFVAYNNKYLVCFFNNQWKNIDLDTSIYINKIVGYKDEFFLATNKGLLFLDKNLNLRYFSNSIPKQEFFTVALENLENKISKIWLAGKGFIAYYDFNNYNILVNSEYITRRTFSENTVIIPNYYNSIIFSSLANVVVVQKDNLRVIPLSLVYSQKDFTANDVFVDRENVIWIVNDRGVTKIPSLRFMNYDKSSGLLENEATSIVEYNGIHYIGHNTGISVALQDYKIIHLKFDNPTPTTRVMDMDVSPFGEIYVAATDKGLLKITKDNRLIKTNFPTKDLVQSVIFDKQGNIFVATNFEVYSKSINNDEFKLIFHSNNQLRKLFIDKEDHIWISTISDGIVKIENTSIKTITGDNAFANSTTAINFDIPDTILVGTKKGLYYVSQNKLKPYWLKIERPIYFIKKFFDFLWIGIDAGVFRWDGKNLVQFGTKQGLSGFETNRDACYLDKFGFLWIGTNAGLTRYNYHFDNLPIPKPIVKIKSINYNISENILISNQQKITLPSNSFNITFDIDVLSFIDENSNTIQYKLEGFDQDWFDFQKNITTNFLFRKLPYGNYRLKLRAKNAVGIVSDEISSPLIVVEKPYYLSPIFILLVLIIISVVIFLVIKYFSNWQYRKKLEEEVKARTNELLESQLRYKQMFVDNNAYMIFYDAQTGIIIEANPSALNYFGIDNNDIGKITIFDLLADKFENQIDFLNNLTEQKEFECIYKIANSEPRNGIIYQSKINLSDKVYVYAIIQDISEKKIAEEELRKLNEALEEIVKIRTAELEKALTDLKLEIQIREKTEKELFEANEKLIAALEKEKELGELKSRFISMVSHEYRTPLTVILSSAYLIKESLKRGLDDEVDRHLHKIHHSVTVMSRLLEDVLTFEKAEEGALEVRLTEFDLREFLLDIVEEASINDQKEHNINLNMPDDNYWINSDRYLLKQIISNLLNNSIKYSEKGTYIDIDCRIQDNAIHLFLKDEGKGISDEDLENIFEPFYRNKKTIGITPGVGLGLAITKRCVELLNGKIEVNNKLDKGVIFKITIPLIRNSTT